MPSPISLMTTAATEAERARIDRWLTFLGGEICSMSIAARFLMAARLQELFQPELDELARQERLAPARSTDCEAFDQPALV
jgi:hypothetical protein